MLLIVYKFGEFKSGENQLYKIVTFSLFIQYMQKFTLRRNFHFIFHFFPFHPLAVILCTPDLFLPSPIFFSLSFFE